MPRPSKKLPACDPCRGSKLACDHKKPVCTRCSSSNRPNQCKYRELPFKKRKAMNSASTASLQGPMVPLGQPSELEMNVEGMVIKPHKYPNPGYLGTFSYTTLFDNLPGVKVTPSSGIGPEAQSGLFSLESHPSEANTAHGAKLVDQVRRHLSPSSYCPMIQAWLAKGTTLALAGLFVKSCIRTAQFLFVEEGAAQSSAEISSILFSNSCQPLTVTNSDEPGDYCAQFCLENARWETVGLFCTAVSRAATDLTYSQTFCESDQGRRELQRLAMHFSDQCLDIAMSLDCLNDLQLFLQYENFILHSMVDGDQSHHSWKRLGDMTSSLFALGHHQQLRQPPNTPDFLISLRRAAFARTYSADKNVSIFLGRPPRILCKYCRFYLPGHSIEIKGRNPFQLHNWEGEVTYDNLLETQWTALCAILKEEILDMVDEEDTQERCRQADTIHKHALAQWSALPARFRLEGPLKLHDQQPVMRDFLVSARLNHLHILFLLRLVLSRGNPQFDVELATISAEIFHIVIEAIMLKDQLANSGTSLVWKVAYYGLPAAGVICLWLLNQSLQQQEGISRSKVIQNLGILVAEIEMGTLVQTDDSNYRLLMSASQTIRNLLDRLLNSGTMSQALDSFQHPTAFGGEGQMDWNPWDGVSLQDFESDFWVNLAEHPIFLGGETYAQSLM